MEKVINSRPNRQIRFDIILVHLVLPERNLMAKQHRGKRVDKNREVFRQGEGQRKNGSYYYSWYDKLHNRHFIYAATLSELREKEEHVNLDLLTGISIDGANLTLNEAIVYWRKSREEDVLIGALKQTTLNQYLAAYDKHVRPAFGNFKIKEITKRKLEMFYKRKMAEGVGLSVLTNIAKPINQTFRIAEDEGWVRHSPTRGSLKAVIAAGRRNRCSSNERIKALTEKEQTSLLDWLLNSDRFEPLGYIVKTMLFTGMRIGELAALQNSDITDGYISIEKSLAYFSIDCDGKKRMARKMQKPKSSAGRRLIPLLDPAKEAIEQYRSWKERNNISLASSVGGYDDFVFLTRKGFPLSSATVNNALTKAVDAINGERKLAGEEIIFPHVSCHWFRRTFATRLCESDVSLRVAQYVLGHADVNITASIYTAVNEELAANEMEKLIKKGVFREKTPLQLTYYQLSRFSQQTARYRHDTSRRNSLLNW